MKKRLEGKVAIITGGAAGIGKAGVLRFLEEGAKVVIADFDSNAIEQTLNEAKTVSADVIGIETDLTNEESVQKMVEETLKHFGTIDVLFNSAALHHAGMLHETSLEDWERVFAVNAKGMFLTCKYVLPIMVAHEKGALINTALPEATAGLRGISAYCASKSAVPALTKSIAIDYAPYHIRANYICPRVVPAEMTQKAMHLGSNPDECGEWNRTARPLGRFGEVVEIANAAVYLASDETCFMTGASIVVDGGFLGQ